MRAANLYEPNKVATDTRWTTFLVCEIQASGGEAGHDVAGG